MSDTMLSETEQRSAYRNLMSHERETQALGLVAGRLAWDRETMMPSGAADQRAEEVGAMQAMIHARQTDPRIGDWLVASGAQAHDEVAQAQLRHIRRRYNRLCRVPGELSAALA